ncbi:MAG: radical SAM protein [Alphaproteobacteria bacterium]|jgi:DNA repair photolyase|nr:radical SAM protein [Alphaproteobacteria bacterium]
MKIKEIEAKNILTKSNLGDMDYAINPYVGCAFACEYCYAIFMSKFSGERMEDWGNYVHVKKNAPDLLRQKLFKMKDKHSSIFISSVTDAWQYVERKYEITRELLKILARDEYPGEITCHTKSPLIERDLDIIKTLPNVVVGITITSSEDSVSGFLEARAPKVSERLKTLKKFNENGIRTYAFIGPLLPHFYSRRDELDEVFKAIKNSGTNNIYVERLNFSNYISRRLKPVLDKADDKTKESFINMKVGSEEYKKLNNFILEMVKKYKMNLLNGTVIEHKK